MCFSHCVFVVFCPPVSLDYLGIAMDYRTPHSPIIFDFAQFLINSGKVEEISAYSPIISRLGFKNEKFLEEMKAFWGTAGTSKKIFDLDKVK